MYEYYYESRFANVLSDRVLFTIRAKRNEEKKTNEKTCESENENDSCKEL